MIITTDMLCTKGACADQVARFIEITGGEVEVTEAFCLAHAQEFAWTWAACHLLSGGAGMAYYEADIIAWKATTTHKAYHEAQARAFANAATAKAKRAA